MAQTPPPSMTAPPTAPSRSDSANFASRGDAFLGWFATQYTDLVAALANVYANAVDAYNNATAASASQASASASEAAAAASAQAAATSAGAAIWVSGTTYAIGDVRWSPVTRYVYRRITAGAGTTDPSADATNWIVASSGGPQLVVSASASNSVLQGQHLECTAAGAGSQTLPASPALGAGDVWIGHQNGRVDNTVDPGSNNINGQSGVMTIGNPYRLLQLRWVGGTFGWRILSV